MSNRRSGVEAHAIYHKTSVYSQRRCSILVFLIMMLIWTSGLTLAAKVVGILPCTVGLMAMFYFLNRRHPEAADRRQLAFALYALAFSIIATVGAINWFPSSIEFSINIFGSDLPLKIGGGPEGIELMALLAVAIVAIVCATHLLAVPHSRKLPGLWGEDWQKQLESSSISKLNKSEHEVHELIFDQFAINPSVLVKRYIEPDCQSLNPANYHEDNPSGVTKEPGAANEKAKRPLKLLTGETLESDWVDLLIQHRQKAEQNTSLAPTPPLELVPSSQGATAPPQRPNEQLSLEDGVESALLWSFVDAKAA